MFKNIFNYLFIFVLSLTFAFFNIYQNVYGLSVNLPGKLYLGSGHWFADYLIYLSIVAQGTRGNWQAYVATTGEQLGGYWVVVWPYLLAGKFGRLIGFTPPVSYWVMVIIFSILAVVLTYLVISLISPRLKYWVLFLYLTAVPFYTIGLKPLSVTLYPVNWYFSTEIFSRISNIPHQMLGGILTLVLFVVGYFWFREITFGLKGRVRIRKMFFYWFFFALLCSLLMTVMPIRLVYLLPAFVTGLLLLYWQKEILSWKNWPVFRPQVIFFVILLIVLVFLSRVTRVNISHGFFADVLQWEIGQMDYPNLFKFFRGSGPTFILSLVVLGCLVWKQKCKWLKKVNPLLFTGLVATLLSYLLFYTPISLLFDNHNSRFLFAEGYLFMSLIVADWLSSISKKVNWLAIITIILAVFAILPLWLFVKMKVQKVNPNSPYEYVNYSLVSAFRNLNPPQAREVVLTAPDFEGRLTLPIFSNTKLYLGRELATVDYEKKNEQAAIFYTNNIPLSEKIRFLQENQIRWFILSDLNRPESFSYWFFNHKGLEGLPVSLEYKNEEMMIYRVNN